MQNRFDEAMDAKEAAIRKFDADLKARFLAHYEHQLYDRNPNATEAAAHFVQQEGLALREAVPFVWAPDILRAVMQAAESLPLDVALNEGWLHASAGWWWFGSNTPLVGQSIVHVDRGMPLQRPVHALVYRHMEQRQSISLELHTTLHGEPTPGPVAMAGHEWRFGQTLKDVLDELNEAKAKEGKRDSWQQSHGGLVGDGLVDYRKTHTEQWVAAWAENMRLAAMVFAAGSLWLSQRVLVDQPAQASRGARRRAEKAGGTSELRVVRLRRTEHAAESEQAQQEGEASGRAYSCQWVVRGHWRNQYYATTKSHRPIWIDPYVKGPDEAPMKTSKTIFAVDR